ncbi:MAG: SURF1 family protein [Candidatus Berkiellales bacterium]
MAKSKLIITLMVFGMITLLCRLGFWQLSRSQEKQAQINQWQHNEQLPPVSNEFLVSHPKALPNLRYLPIRITTEFLNQNTILIDNKIHKGRVGYYVYVPAVLDDNTVILINRGWIPLGHSRNSLPQPSVTRGQVTIEGYLDFAYRNRFIKDMIESNQWPLRMQQLDIELLSKRLGKEVYPMLVMLNASSPYVFAPQEAPVEWLNPKRHQGYAVQWFGLAFTLLILYLFYFFRSGKGGAR